MQASFLMKLRQEPYATGIITAFAALSSAAIINVTMGLVLGQERTAGTSGLLFALTVSAIAAGAAVFRSWKLNQERIQELEFARRIASTNLPIENVYDIASQTALAQTLQQILDQQMTKAIESENAIKDFTTREAFLVQALDSVSDEIAIFDKSGLLIFTNNAYLSYCNQIGAIVALGMSRKDVWSALAKAPQAKLPLNERQTWMNFQEDMRKDAGVTGEAVAFTRFNGSAAQLRLTQLKDGSQIEFIRSTAELAQSEARAQKAEREANTAHRAKQSALSQLSHTIRTPMTGVLTAAELLSDSDLDSKQRARLDIIRRSAGTLLGVVQDLFEMASSATSIEPANNPVVRLEITRALIFSGNQTGVEKLRIDLELKGFEVAVAESDEILRKAIEVLSANGTKLDLILAPDSAAAECILECLSAISMSARPEIRIDATLAANADVVDLQAEKLALHQPNTDSILDVLIVESNDVHQISFANFLAGSNVDFVIVSNGKQAVETIDARKPRLILMDVSMPDMNGLEVTETLRNKHASTYTPVIVGMTNHFVSGDMSKCINAGMNSYSAKPQTAAILKEHIDTWLNYEPMKKAG